MAKQPVTPDSQAAEPQESSELASSGKGHATPTRAEREAARKRPLVPGDRKAAAKDARSQNSTARDRARAGMAAGDDRYLTARDKGPQRKYVRDYVDARFNVGEFMIPVMLVVIILTFLPLQALQFYGIIVLWVFFVIAIIDCFVLAFRVQRKIGEKFGATKVERGLRWYSAMRALQLRIIRLPKPQAKRGQYPS